MKRMNKRISKFHLLVGILIIIATSMSIWCTVTAITENQLATSVKPGNTIYTESEIVSYLTQMAKNKNSYAMSITVSNKSTKSLMTSVSNLDQNLMNDAYNDKYSKNYTGTCTIVADTQALKRFTSQTNEDDIFADTLNEAINIKAFTPPNKGTYAHKNDTLMDNMFKFYNDSTDANNDHLNIPKTLVGEINANRPVVLHVPDHSVVVTKYHNYSVLYVERYWSWTKYKYRSTSFDTIVFEVNNGWHDYRSGTEKYYPSDAINSTSYGITKFSG